MGRGKKKKQVPRNARNDNLGVRRAGGWVGLVGYAEWPARSRAEARPGHAERIRRSWGAWEGSAVGRVGVGGVASGEWGVGGDESRGFGGAATRSDWSGWRGPCGIPCVCQGRTR